MLSIHCMNELLNLYSSGQPTPIKASIHVAEMLAITGGVNRGVAGGLGIGEVSTPPQLVAG